MPVAPHARPADLPSVRIDKWLWAARFFKTRSLATEAVEGGKVKCNDERVKPSKQVKVGDWVVVPMGWDEAEVQVIGLSDKRGSAQLAQTLYKETAESLAKRQQRAEFRAMSKDPARDITARPTKRDRRALDRFTD